jgi:site-specific DNA recombinase
MARPETITSGRHGQLTVQSIETEPMTGQQRDRAVSALAALTRAWSESRSAATAVGALPLPLPGAPSNTDHGGEEPAASPPPAGQRPREGHAMTRIARQQPTLAADPLHDDVRVGVYVRRSTDDEHQPYSIQAQDTRLAAYIGSQPGWRQAGPTGGPGARAGAIDVLLVYRVDRLTRSLRDLVTLLDDLDRAGVVFRSATEPFDTATAMGRMLVQMLGMFAQFERDTIIDRVIAGMERKAAAGKWKGGRRPFGYQVNSATSTLVPDPAEAGVVRLAFDLYTRDRHGARTIASALNDRGHRTTTGGTWSAHQVVRVLSNRVYLGELTFRGITTTRCHPPIIENGTFADAQRILAARGEDYSKRAANGSDYLLTGLMRCPSCGKAMIGTRAHGRSRVYRYYTCFTRLRYEAARCDAARLDADAVEDAVIAGLLPSSARADRRRDR